MFVLITAEDTVRVPPSDLAQLERDMMTAIRTELHAKYANKIIPNRGLAMAVHSILSHNPPQIYPGDGGAYIRARFRLIMFQPFESEVLAGKIKHVSPAGIYVSLGFFDWVFIPPENLPSPSRWVPEERAWLWDYDGSEFFIDLGDEVRVRVTRLDYRPYNQKSVEMEDATDPVKHYAYSHGYLLTQSVKEEEEAAAGNSAASNAAFKAQSGAKDAATAAVAAAALGGMGMGDSPQQQQHAPPFKVTATIADQGLGPVSWW